jgi:hypothetical protein
MTQEKMTIHKALCDVKLADKKIQQLLSYGNSYVEVNTDPTNANFKIRGKSVPEFSSEVSSNYQTVRDTMKRVDAIKSAISKSNASTIINVGGKEMTVAEAIYQMKYGIKAKKQLLGTLQTQLQFAQSKLEDAVKKNEAKLAKTIETVYGNKEKGNVNTDTLMEFMKKYSTDNQPVLIDPINISKEINRLSMEIDVFELNVDSAIQVSNATTTIEIEY